MFALLANKKSLNIFFHLELYRKEEINCHYIREISN